MVKVYYLRSADNRTLEREVRELLNCKATVVDTINSSAFIDNDNYGWVNSKLITEAHELDGHGAIVFSHERVSGIHIYNDQFIGRCTAQLSLVGFNEDEEFFTTLTQEIENTFGKYICNFDLRIGEDSEMDRYDLMEDNEFFRLAHSYGVVNAGNFYLSREELLQRLQQDNVDYHIVEARIVLSTDGWLDENAYMTHLAEITNELRERRGYSFQVAARHHKCIPLLKWLQIPGKKILEDPDLRLVYEIDNKLFPDLSRYENDGITKRTDLITGEEVNGSTFRLCESVDEDEPKVVNFGFVRILNGYQYPERREEMINALRLPLER